MIIKIQKKVFDHRFEMDTWETLASMLVFGVPIIQFVKMQQCTVVLHLIVGNFISMIRVESSGEFQGRKPN